MTTQTINIKYYVSEKGFYVNGVPYGHILNDEKAPLDTFSPNWKLYKSAPEVLKRKNTNIVEKSKYTIKDSAKSLAEELSLPFETSDEYAIEDYENLYNYTPAKYEEVFTKVNFNVECLGNIEVSDHTDVRNKEINVTRYVGFQESINPVNIKSITLFSELEQMLTPEFALHDRPCFISSKTTYDIVRAHVLENIDKSQAVVTSNYDFCFTVKKLVKVKPYTVKRELFKSNGKSYKSPKFSKKLVEHIQVEVFEMTHNLKNYSNYTVIEGFKGDNINDLCNNIKAYLDELMEVINQPIRQCECCKGTGHIVDQNFEINKRN